MSMLDWALRYCDLGYSVIPMNEKKPYVKFADQTFTRDEVIELWTKYPNANIALRTTDFLVVDIDRHDGGADGYVSIAMYEHPDHFPNTLFQTTPSGGEQLFFKKRNGYPVTQKIGWLEGVDIKAHPNNYILVPPSTTKKGTYEWALVERNGEVFTPTEMVEAPQGLVDSISTSSASSDVDVSYGGFVKVDFKPKKQGSKNATTELIEMVAHGFGSKNTGRNDKLAKFVGRLLFRGVDIKEVRALALQTNKNSIDPLSDKEVIATTNSIIKKHLREVGTIGESSGFKEC